MPSDLVLRATFKVASVLNEYKVVLNAGSDAGVSVGDEFLVWRVGEEIFDPDTNESLGVLEQVIGKGTITHVQERLSTLEASETLDSGRKIIRRRTGVTSVAAALSSILGPETEEIVELPDAVRPFRHAQIGDHAKAI